jgi:hypothetical protein
MFAEITNVEAKTVLFRIGSSAFVSLFVLSLLFAIFGSPTPNAETGETWPIQLFNGTCYVAPWLPRLREALFFVSVVCLVASVWFQPPIGLSNLNYEHSEPLWRVSPTFAAIAVLLVLIGAISASSLGVVALIGQSRPVAANANYPYSHAFEGSMRYFSPGEDFILRWAEPTAGLALTSFLLAMFIAGWRTTK